MAWHSGARAPSGVPDTAVVSDGCAVGQRQQRAATLVRQFFPWGRWQSEGSSLPPPWIGRDGAKDEEPYTEPGKSESCCDPNEQGDECVHVVVLPSHSQVMNGPVGQFPHRQR
jgi:hypothetical protein